MRAKYDLVVIGSGPAGEKGAAQAAYFGKTRRCWSNAAPTSAARASTPARFPAKFSANPRSIFQASSSAGLYGVDYSLREGLTVKNFMHRKDVLVEIEREKMRENLAAHDIDLIQGVGIIRRRATPCAVAARLKMKSLNLRGEAILIATGSAPQRAPEIPFDDEVIFDSDSILKMDAIPRSLAVVGGGVIGCEYASIFTALGVEVALVDGRDRVLPFLDAEISEACANGSRISGFASSSASAWGRSSAPSRACASRCNPARTIEIGSGAIRGRAARRGGRTCISKRPASP